MNRRANTLAGAAGAVSVGMVLLGACGLQQHDTYVAPPPLSAADSGEPAAAALPVAVRKTSAVVIPPSPSWKIAPVTVPRHTTTTTSDLPPLGFPAFPTPDDEQAGAVPPLTVPAPPAETPVAPLTTTPLSTHVTTPTTITVTRAPATTTPVAAPPAAGITTAGTTAAN